MQRTSGDTATAISTIGPKYVEVLTERPVERFLWQFKVGPMGTQSLVLVSPIIGALRGVRVTLRDVLDRINRERIPTFVITCTPQPDDVYHQEAITILKQSPWVEIRFNDSLHAKLYICHRRDHSFALLGSGNLTPTSVKRNIEIGVLLSARSHGRDIIHELNAWGTDKLRHMEGTRLEKPMSPDRRR